MPYLIPRNANLTPTTDQRRNNQKRIEGLSSQNFKKYSDYFFFIHIDPYLRFWHWTGMLIGLYFFTLLFIGLPSSWSLALAKLSLGIFFFYGLALVAHYLYDGGAAKTEPGHFIDSTPTIIYINLLSGIGLYQKRLQRFIAEYPFTVKAFDLIERPTLWERLKGHAAHSLY